MSLGPNSVINNVVIKYGGLSNNYQYPALSIGDAVTVTNSEISNNYSDGVGVSGSPIIKDNIISGNGGIGIKISGSPTITGNIITAGSFSSIGLKLSGSPLVSANKISGFDYGVYFYTHNPEQYHQ